MLLVTIGNLGRIYLQEVNLLHLFSFSNSSSKEVDLARSMIAQKLKQRYNVPKDSVMLPSADAIKQYESDLKELQPFVSKMEIEALESKGNALKEKVQAVNVSEKDRLNQILNQESETLYQFIVQNNWPNLKKLAERYQLRSNVIIQSKNFHQIIQLNIGDIQNMVNLIETSQIKPDNKSSLLGRLRPLLDQWRSYEDILEHYYEVQALHQDYLNSLQTLLKKEIFQTNASLKSSVASATTVKHTSAELTFSLVSLFLLIFSLFSYFLFQGTWNRLELQRQERHYLHVIDRALLKSDQSELQDHSPTFRSTLMNVNDYLQKRISFGQIFQDGIPFAALLVEESRQIKWFNRHFIDQWEIDSETLSKERLSWDFLVNMTNIGSNDPVAESLVTQNHGIYQVQIKPFKSSDSKSYQMFVCPVQNDGRSQCLLFFYPLMTLEETINIQTKSIVNPVKRTLESMLDDQYGPKFEATSLRDYEIGDIGQIHALFSDVYKKFEFKWNQLIEEIQLADLSLQEKYKLIDKVSEFLASLKIENKENAKLINGTKDHLLKISQNSTQLSETSLEAIYSTKLVSQSYQQLFTLHRRLKEELGRIVQAGQWITPLKQQIKEHRELLTQSKMIHNKLLKYLHSSVEKYVSKTPGAIVDPVVKEIPKIQEFWSQDEKIVMHFDTFFSKLNLLVDDLKKVGLEQVDDIVAVTKVQEDGQRLEKIIEKVRNDISLEEEKFADSIKRLFAHGLSFNQKLQGLDQLIRTAEENDDQVGPTNHTNTQTSHMISKANILNQSPPPQLPANN